MTNVAIVKAFRNADALTDTLEDELEEARDYAASLLDRIWHLGHELERVRTALAAYQEEPGIETERQFTGDEWWDPQ